MTKQSILMIPQFRKPPDEHLKPKESKQIEISIVFLSWLVHTVFFVEVKFMADISALWIC